MKNKKLIITLMAFLFFVLQIQLMVNKMIIK